jgi:hypothetical protein
VAVNEVGAAATVEALKQFDADGEPLTYATPQVEAEIAAVGIGTDGSCLLMCKGQWHAAMTGSISLYDRRGERQHTIHVGAAPEHGRASFHERMAREIAHVKQLYPRARYVGIADGAKSNWDFLGPHVDEEILDFYHATEYVTQAADALFAGGPLREREAWLESRCSTLKHDWDGAKKLLAQWGAVDTAGWERERRKMLEDSMRYFANHLHRMDYKRY